MTAAHELRNWPNSEANHEVKISCRSSVKLKILKKWGCGTSLKRTRKIEFELHLTCILAGNKILMPLR